MSLDAFIFATFTALIPFALNYMFDVVPLADNLKLCGLFWFFMYGGAAVTDFLSIKE